MFEQVPSDLRPARVWTLAHTHVTSSLWAPRKVCWSGCVFFLPSHSPLIALVLSPPVITSSSVLFFSVGFYFLLCQRDG